MWADAIAGTAASTAKPVTTASSLVRFMSYLRFPVVLSRIAAARIDGTNVAFVFA